MSKAKVFAAKKLNIKLFCAGSQNGCTSPERVLTSLAKEQDANVQSLPTYLHYTQLQAAITGGKKSSPESV